MDWTTRILENLGGQQAMHERLRLCALVLLAVCALGCRGKFDNLDDLNGQSKSAVRERLGEPEVDVYDIFREKGFGPHRALKGLLEVGHPYEFWQYRHEGDLHTLIFADPSDAESDPETWRVVLVDTLPAGHVY
jgi:hypothetical protein